MALRVKCLRKYLFIHFNYTRLKKYKPIYFQITVGHSDYKSIMNILQQNLTEGQKKVPEEIPSQKVVASTSKIQVKSTKDIKVYTKSTVEIVEKTKKARTSIKFAFTMDSFVIDLFTTTSVSLVIVISSL